MFLLVHNTHRMVIRHHKKIGHMWVPNQCARIPHERGAYYLRTNSQGFRSDVEFERAKGPKPRILFLGDSITAGDGCYNQERYSDLVGKKIGADVYNFALSGSGTDQQLLIYEEFVKNFEADLIVWCIPVHNVDRIKAAYRPTIDRVSRKRLLVPKPYFTLDENGELVLHNVPVSTDRPEESEQSNKVHRAESHRDANPSLKWAYKIADILRSDPRFEKVGRFLSPKGTSDHTALRAFLLRKTKFDPYPDYQSHDSDGCQLLTAMINRLLSQGNGVPVMIVPIPDQHYYITGLDAKYQTFFNGFDAPENNVHVIDITKSLQNLPLEQRKKLCFEYDSHFSPFGNDKIAELISVQIKQRSLLKVDQEAPLENKPVSLYGKKKSKYVLGLSCFYHNSGACLVADGEIIAAAEEERFSRVKADRRFPHNAINFCLEQGQIDVRHLNAVVYYDNTQLTFERLITTVVCGGEDARDLWHRTMPSWVQYKLHIPTLIRKYLKYEGEVLQNLHHRSHLASAFFPSPYKSAAILTIDGVGEWATASIGVGRGNKIEILKEIRFPHSLGLLYSAFTQYLGFKVNDGEYKMMGLAPYGEPKYVDAILENLVHMYDDGSIQLNMECFAYLTQPTMTNDRFADVFGGPARKDESHIARREMDLAKSIQWVTEESMLRMCREAQRLTGESLLCMSGGVALNCVANGRILREGPFDDIWIQPAAGDSGSALGAALDVSHSYFGQARVYSEDGRSIQKGSYLGPEFSQNECEAFLETYGYPYTKYTPEERSRLLAKLLEEGKVIGHFAGRSEFGPRALGSRSILGDPRNQEMQVTLNLKIKYRESFRPFAPVVLSERIGDYFELDRESPYMLIVAPVREERRLPYNPVEDDDMLSMVRMPRSDLPAITHVDYSARIQSVMRSDHPQYYDLIKAFEQLNGCGVLVNTSFNVRGEPIVNTPQDAYRVFVGTEMDVLALNNCILIKDQQPPSQEHKGHLDNRKKEEVVWDAEFMSEIVNAFDEEFLPLVSTLDMQKFKHLISKPFGKNNESLWEDFQGPSSVDMIFKYPAALLCADAGEDELAKAITSQWSDKELGLKLENIVSTLIRIGRKYAKVQKQDEEVSESMYVMF